MELLTRTLGLAMSRKQALRTLAFFVGWERIGWAAEKLAPQVLRGEERTLFGDRAVGLAHALLTSGLCTWILLVDEDENREKMNNDHLYGLNEGALLLFSSSCGYFLWDLFVTLSKAKLDVGFMVHAVACFLCYLFGQFPYLHYYGVRFLLFELSTPFLNVMLLLRQLGHKGKLHNIVQNLFGASFFLVRILYGFPLSYLFWKESLTLLQSGKQHSTFVVVYYLVANLALNGLNAFWLLSMLRKRSKAN